MIGRGSARWRGTRLALLMLAVAGVVVVGLVIRTSGGPAEVGASDRSPRPGSPAPSESASASPSDSGIGVLRPLPSGLDDRGWIAEAGARWIAGSLGGRILVLPKDEIGLVASAGIVVSVRFNNGGATSTVMIRDLSNGRLRLSVDRPGTVGSAVVAGGRVYIAGDTSLSGPADAGVQAIALTDGTVRDLIAPGTGPADATGLVSRSQLRLSPSGALLGSGLCEADRCWVDVVDLATGSRSTPIRGQEGFLTALNEGTLYTVNETSTHLWAVDVQTGSVRWSLDDAQIGGMFATSDGSRLVLGYLPGLSRGGPFTFTVGSADSRTGAVQRLLERDASSSAFSLFAGLSNDHFAVIGPGATLGEGLAGVRARLALTLVDIRSGAALADAVTLVAP